MISEAIAFSSSQTGLTLTAALAALVIVVWDWRVALAALFVIQASIGAATVHLSGVPFEWVLIQTAVMGLSCLILGMSAAQAMQSSPSSRQAGSLWLRIMAVAMLYGGWRLLDVSVTLPETDPGVAQLYGWLALCALLILGLGASPLFSGVAILLWIVIVQAFVASVLEIPSLVALVGILELLVALACSYLLLAEWTPSTRERPILTDVAFPVQPVHAEIGIWDRLRHGLDFCRRRPPLAAQGQGRARHVSADDSGGDDAVSSVARPESSDRPSQTERDSA